jgi:drug/metabolite transporter (DMT)-like permease
MALSVLVYYPSKQDPISQKSRTGQNSPKGLTIIAMIIAILFWASAFPAIPIALTAYTSTEVAFLRYAIASIILIGYAIVRRISLPQSIDWPLIALCGFTGFTLYNIMLNAGEMTVSPGIASFIISTEVCILALLAWLFFDERLGKKGWIGAILCITGVGIIALSAGGKFQLSWGIAQLFIATLSISFYSAMQKPLLSKYTAIEFTSYAIWTGTLFLFFLAPQAVRSAIEAPVVPTLAIIYMGAFPGVIAHIAWSYVLSKIPASQAASYLAFIPVAVLAIAWLWLSEMPNLVSMLGGTIIFVGALLVNLRKL